MLKESLRFIGEEVIPEELNLTKEEIEIFDKFEWAVLCDNGLRQINGGYAKVTIYDIDYDDKGNEILVCEVECGEQNMGSGHSSCDRWQVNYNRKTQKFEEK